MNYILLNVKTMEDYLAQLIRIRKGDWTTEEDNEMRRGSQRNEAVPPPRQASACTALDLLVKCALTIIHTVYVSLMSATQDLRPRNLTLFVS